MNNGIAYIFLDESGNFDFSPKGTRYFSLCGVSTQRPLSLYEQLDNYKYDLIESGLNIEFFHHAHDKRKIQSEVFKILSDGLDQLSVYSLIVEKRKTVPPLQKAEALYPRMLGYLLRYVFHGYDLNKVKEIVVITDTLPIRRNRREIEKSVKMALARVSLTNVPYRILHHASKAHYGLQIADYCSGAIFRKWERGNEKNYNNIKPAIRIEYDIFQRGTRNYY